MTEHYTANTESVTKFCNRCMRNTQHAVSAGRVGRCMEHEPPEQTKAQERRARDAADRAEAEKQGDLFGKAKT
jgi:hypothetical protein